MSDNEAGGVCDGGVRLWKVGSQVGQVGCRVVVCFL